MQVTWDKYIFGWCLTQATIASAMEGRLLSLLCLIGFSSAANIPHDSSKCSTQCSQGTKFAYSDAKLYRYSYEASNRLHMAGSAEITTRLKASLRISVISECEMVLQIEEASVTHGSKLETTSAFIDNLKREPLRFSWENGVIRNVCPSPNADAEVVNIQRGMVSALQNSMRSMTHDLFLRETDIFGNCNTDYKVKSYAFGSPKVIIHKTKDLSTCAQHLKGKTAFSASFYDSLTSPNQDLPFLSNRTFACSQIINLGIIEEVLCEEKGQFKPVSEFGYKVDLTGEVKMQLISTENSLIIPNAITNRQSLAFHYEPKYHTVQESEAESTLRDLCSKVEGLLKEDVGLVVHKLVHMIRGLSKESVENLYNSLKSGELCTSPKALGIYLDALKAAATGGAVHLLAKLSTTHEISEAEVMLWLASMPFFGNPDEETVKAAVPLLAKEFGSRQAVLAVSAMAHKFCSHHPNCESVPAVQDVISSLDALLGDNCKTTTTEETDEILTVLKAFGNLGQFGDSRKKILECAFAVNNAFVVRITAVQAFRRSSCNDEARSKLLELFKKTSDDDAEIRIHAFLTFIKCPSRDLLNQIHEIYNNDPSRQVSAFVWSYFNNVMSSSDPSKRQLQSLASGMFQKKPEFTDLTKFSRNFEKSIFSDFLNLGASVESNLIYTRHSFLPRSGNLDFSLDMFGYKLKLFELGLRIEDIEFILEHFFGPHGKLSKLNLPDLWHQLIKNVPNHGRTKRDVSAYEQKLKVLDERVEFIPWYPRGFIYYRILGNEFRWRRVDNRTAGSFGDFDLKEMLRRLEQYKHVDVAHSVMFFDTTILIPSATGRAYKLASNGSATVGLKADGNINIRQASLPRLTAKVNRRYQPSAVVELGATLSLHSEDYEPGVRVSTTLHVGQDVELKAEITNGHSLSALLNFPAEDNKIYSLKREFFVLDQDGERKIDPSSSHTFEYCTRYLDQIIGLHFCSKSVIPHGLIGGPMSSELTMQKVEKGMRGFEFILEIPDRQRQEEMNFRFSIDTPGSSVSRKLSTEVLVKQLSPEQCTADVKFHSPFYTFDASGTYLSNSDVLELKMEAEGSKKRQYKVDLHVEKIIKGARLAEFRPTLKLSLPFKDNMVFSGTVVFHNGRKEQISINMQSESFGSPITIRGNVAKEGELLGADSDCRLSSDVTLIVELGTFRLYGGIGKQSSTSYLADVALDYEIHAKRKQTIKLASKIENVHFADPLSFTAETEILLTEAPYYNSITKWEFSANFMEHLKNEITLRYGPNFDDENQVIHFKQINSFGGDFQTFRRMNIENEFGLTIPFFRIDKSVSFTGVWDFDKNLKFHVNVGVKHDERTKLGIELEYHHLSIQPVKITTEARLEYFDYEFAYRDQVQEISPNELQGRLTIESGKSAFLTLEYVYKMKSFLPELHHELEGSVFVPGSLIPIQQKATIKSNSNGFMFYSHTDSGGQSPYIIDVKLKSLGKSEISIQFPHLTGAIDIDSQPESATLRANFDGKDQRKITASGTMSSGTINLVELEILLDAVRNPRAKVSIKGSMEDVSDGTVGQRAVMLNVNYLQAIYINVHGTVSNRLLFGPHNLRADFSGNIEPTSVVFSHKFEDNKLDSFVQYLRSDVQKLRADLTWKYIQRGYNLDFETGLSIKSPFKTFDGKEIYYKLYIDSSDASRNLATEYRLNHAVALGYVGRIEYSRKRGWPGNIRNSILFTTDGRIVYEEKTAVEYGNRKYRLTTTFSPHPPKKLNLDTSFEYAARYANFHHALFTSLQRVQTVRLDAVADFREKEYLKLQTLLDVNSNRIYDFNGTFTSRSVTDFEGHLLLFSQVTPSLHIRTRANNGNSLTKYTFNVQKGDEDIITGNGVIRMRKKGFNGDAVLKYRDRELVNMEINNEVKSQREKNYAIKAVVGSSTYTANIQWLKEKRAIKRVIALCVGDSNMCIDISAVHKEVDGKNEWHVTYKRADVLLNFDRTVFRTADSSRYFATVQSGDKRYGYDIRLGREGEPQSFFLGLISPSREISLEADYNLHPEDFRLKLGILSDAKKEPNRKLVLDVKSLNRFGRQSSTATDISLSHPILEKPLELKIVANCDYSSSKPFSVEVETDFSKNPEEKLIAKIHTENSDSDSSTKFLYFELYHKDDQNLLLNGKVHRSRAADHLSYGVEWKWLTQTAEDKEVSLNADFYPKDHKFLFVYQRPNFNYKVTAVGVFPPERPTPEIDIDFDSNGEITKSKIVYYFQGNCYHANFLIPETEFSHKTAICSDPWSPIPFSVKTETSGEDMEVLDNSLEIIQREPGVLHIREQWSSDFLGILTFQLMTLIEEIGEGVEGTIPQETIRLFKSMGTTIREMIITPIKQFAVSESAKLRNDIVTEYRSLASVLIGYYRLLPLPSDILVYLKPVGLLVVDFANSICEDISNRIPQLREYYQIIKENGRSAWNYCSENQDCSHMVKSITEGDYEGVLKVLRAVASSLPGKLQNIGEYSEVLNGWLYKAYERLVRYYERLVQYSEPFLEYPYINGAIKHFQYLYVRIQLRYGKQIEELLSKIVQGYRNIRQSLLKNEYVLRMIESVKRDVQKLRNDLQALDLQQLYNNLQRWIEEYLSKSTLPSNTLLASPLDVHYDRGTADVTLNIPVDLADIKTIYLEVLNLYRAPSEIWETASRSFVKTLIVNVKRTADLNVIPPFEEQAVIVGNHHFITFDKLFYDFAGQCSYLLARDFDNGNFSLVLKHPERGSSEGITIIFIVGHTSVEVNTGDKTIKVDGRPVELPYLAANVTATQEENTIVVNDRHGVVLKCHLIHELCSVVIPGWYFGKTAGLYGTYNYESFDDFKRPRGQVAHSIGPFARSWELDKGCKTKNLAEEDEVAKDTPMYKTCSDIFDSSTSSLATCFSEVRPTPYFKLCLRHASSQTDSKKVLCNVAAAYISECERNYIDMNLPSQCLQCEAPDGSSMTFGQKRKFESSQRKSADIVFVIENHSCNQRFVQDLNAIARSIDRELENSGFRENMYGVVSYGGHEGRPFGHTERGKAFFGVQEINLNLQAVTMGDKSRASVNALEALKYAVRYPFRSGTSKSFVLFSCTPCIYDYKSLEFPVVQQILLDHAINLHVVNNQGVLIRKSSAKGRDIIGVDANTVYTVKDVVQRELVGEPSLRSQVSLPKDMCVALSQDVNGSFFTSKSLSDEQPADLKNWRSILARRLLKTTEVPGCQWCDCTTTNDNVARTVCQPCSILKPRLPFSVCKDCSIPRYVEAFVSYLLHLAS